MYVIYFVDELDRQIYWGGKRNQFFSNKSLAHQYKTEKAALKALAKLEHFYLNSSRRDEAINIYKTLAVKGVN